VASIKKQPPVPHKKIIILETFVRGAIIEFAQQQHWLALGQQEAFTNHM
jgi:hypothetical protein